MPSLWACSFEHAEDQEEVFKELKIGTLIGSILCVWLVAFCDF